MMVLIPFDVAEPLTSDPRSQLAAKRNAKKTQNHPQMLHLDKIHTW